MCTVSGRSSCTILSVSSCVYVCVLVLLALDDRGLLQQYLPDLPLGQLSFTGHPSQEVWLNSLEADSTVASDLVRSSAASGASWGHVLDTLDHTRGQVFTSGIGGCGYEVGNCYLCCHSNDNSYSLNDSNLKYESYRPYG